MEALTNRCRICKSTENLNWIFDRRLDYQNMDTRDMIFVMTKVKVSLKDVISQKICEECHQDCKDFVDFQKKSKANTCILQKRCEELLNNLTINENTSKTLVKDHLQLGPPKVSVKSHEDKKLQNQLVSQLKKEVAKKELLLEPSKAAPKLFAKLGNTTNHLQKNQSAQYLNEMITRARSLLKILQIKPHCAETLVKDHLQLGLPIVSVKSHKDQNLGKQLASKPMKEVGKKEVFSNPSEAAPKLLAKFGNTTDLSQNKGCAELLNNLTINEYTSNGNIARSDRKRKLEETFEEKSSQIKPPSAETFIENLFELGPPMVSVKSHTDQKVDKPLASKPINEDTRKKGYLDHIELAQGILAKCGNLTEPSQNNDCAELLNNLTINENTSNRNIAHSDRKRKLEKEFEEKSSQIKLPCTETPVTDHLQLGPPIVSVNSHTNQKLDEQLASKPIEEDAKKKVFLDPIEAVQKLMEKYGNTTDLSQNNRCAQLLNNFISIASSYMEKEMEGLFEEESSRIKPPCAETLVKDHLQLGPPIVSVKSHKDQKVDKQLASKPMKEVGQKEVLSDRSEAAPKLLAKYGNTTELSQNNGCAEYTSNGNIARSDRKRKLEETFEEKSSQIKHCAKTFVEDHLQLGPPIVSVKSQKDQKVDKQLVSKPIKEDAKKVFLDPSKAAPKLFAKYGNTTDLPQNNQCAELLNNLTINENTFNRNIARLERKRKLDEVFEEKSSQIKPLCAETPVKDHLQLGSPMVSAKSHKDQKVDKQLASKPKKDVSKKEVFLDPSKAAPKLLVKNGNTTYLSQNNRCTELLNNLNINENTSNGNIARLETRRKPAEEFKEKSSQIKPPCAETLVEDHLQLEPPMVSAKSHKNRKVDEQLSSKPMKEVAKKELFLDPSKAAPKLLAKYGNTTDVSQNNRCVELLNNSTNNANTSNRDISRSENRKKLKERFQKEFRQIKPPCAKSLVKSHLKLGLPIASVKSHKDQQSNGKLVSENMKEVEKKKEFLEPTRTNPKLFAKYGNTTDRSQKNQCAGVLNNSTINANTFDRDISNSENRGRLNERSRKEFRQIKPPCAKTVVKDHLKLGSTIASVKSHKDQKLDGKFVSEHMKEVAEKKDFIEPSKVAPKLFGKYGNTTERSQKNRRAELLNNLNVNENTSTRDTTYSERKRKLKESFEEKSSQINPVYNETLFKDQLQLEPPILSVKSHTDQKFAAKRMKDGTESPAMHEFLEPSKAAPKLFAKYGYKFAGSQKERNAELADLMYKSTVNRNR